MRSIRPRKTLIAAGLFVAVIGMTPHDKPVETNSWLFSTTFADFGGCVDCWVCDPGHGAADHGDPLSQYAEGHGLHSCSGFTSCFEHGTCGGAFASADQLDALRDRLDAMRMAIFRNDVKSIGQYLDPTGDPRIVWVAERSAIQVIGCGERVLVHLPLEVTLAHLD